MKDMVRRVGEEVVLGNGGGLVIPVGLHEEQCVSAHVAGKEVM